MTGQQPKVLYVDDDQNLLEAVRRQQRNHLSLTLCAHPKDALEVFEREGPFAVVVSDLRMPELDGIELLQEIQARNADTVRIMLTGNADLEAAKRAVNDGHIFRFLTKPCEPEILREAVRAGQRIYELVVGERELLERTVRGSVEVLTDVLGLVNPAAFGRAARIRSLVRGITDHLRLEGAWQFEVGAMLSQIGCVTVPTGVIEAAYAREEIPPETRAMFDAHPRVGAQLIRPIPRLECVAEMIALQDARYDGEGAEDERPRGDDLPIGARILKVALDFDAARSTAAGPMEAVEELATDPGAYDPTILAALDVVARLASEQTHATVSLLGLQVGMTIAESLYTENGVLLITAGQEVSVSALKHLHNRMSTGRDPVIEPIHVLIPPGFELDEASRLKPA